MCETLFCVNLYESTNLKCSFSEEYNLVSDAFSLDPGILKKNDMFDYLFTSKSQLRNSNGF